MKVVWTSRARGQLRGAVLSLEERGTGSGAALAARLRHLLTLLAQRPRTFPAMPGVAEAEVRRALVLKYQLWVIYEVQETAGRVVILSLWPTRRHPAGWRGE